VHGVVVVPGMETSPGWEARPAGPLILVVDGQPLFVVALAHLLSTSALCARTVTAERSDSALKLLRQERFDLVLCDVRIHPVSFQEFLDEAASLPKPPPVVLLGDAKDAGLLVAAIAGQAAGLFTKDADPGQFLEGVQAVLSGHRAFGENIMQLVVGRLNGQHASGTRPGLAQLSPTEVDILAMVGAARSVQAIAAARGITQKTVRNHLANIYRKLELSSRTEAMLCAARMGLTTS
jgi:DNA-binding NarL/FixJ family response regulator